MATKKQDHEILVYEFANLTALSASLLYPYRESTKTSELFQKLMNNKMKSKFEKDYKAPQYKRIQEIENESGRK